MALACLLPGLRDMTRSAQADPPMYRIVPLEPDSTDILAQCRVLGINNKGQVTGFVHLEIDSQLVPRAFLWVPHEVTIDSVVYPTGVLIILLHPGESIEELDPRPSVGRAINEDMQIAGAVAIDDTLGGIDVGLAFLWIPEEALPEDGTHDLWPARQMTVLPHGLPDNDAGIWSDAWDLTEMTGDEIRVVGGRRHVVECSQSEPETTIGFAWDSAVRASTSLPTGSSARGSMAMSIAPTALTSSSQDRIVGYVDNRCEVFTCGIPLESPVGRDTDPSDPPWTDLSVSFRSAWWEPTWTLRTMDVPEAFDPQENLWTTGRGISDLLMATGAGTGSVTDPEELSCLILPLYWPTLTAMPVILPTPLNIHDVPNQGYGNAINDLSEPSVVGKDMTGNAAVLWEIDPFGPSLTYLDLNDPEFTNTSACDWIQLIEAFDVNSGVDESLPWIVGYGRRDASGLPQRGFVLVPIAPCDADLDGTPGVGFGDYQVLLGRWGDCPANTICWADLDGDCTVGNADLIELLGMWGACDEEESALSGMPVEDALMGLWLTLGGMQAIESESIHMDRVMELLATEPLIDGVIALFNELSMEVPE
ncbi:MAG: hypothetical protein KF817_05325 [Phycisphaeraceae bacterium]|nr:hypothetical protein [Phycisphaeraceae bacterium]